MADDDLQALAETIRQARLDHGWSQQQLADRAQIAVPTINRCERAKVRVSPRVARQLWQALELDPRQLPVVLGYVTAEEMNLPAVQAPTYRPATAQAIQLLENSTVSDDIAAEWVAMLEFLTTRHRQPRRSDKIDAPK